MSETSQHKLYWLPNALTVGRILLIPVLVWAIMSGKYSRSDIFDGYAAWRLALFIFLLCMASDYLDGYLARKWKVTSDFGRMLDPIADKLLVAACLIALNIFYLGTWDLLIPSLIIIGRDITVSGVREYAALSRRALPPTKLAKWKTAAEMLGIIIVLVSNVINMNMHNSDDGNLDMYFFSLEPHESIFYILNIGIGIIWLAAILSAYTGFLYFRAALAKTEE